MKILLAVDNSGASRAAVDQVARRPWPEGASIEVVHVLEPVHLWVAADTAQELSRLAHAVVEDSAATLRERHLSAKGRLLEGDPRRTILDHASKTGADCIILGARGATGIERWLLGSVSTAILRHAPCSVEIVRGRPGPPRSGWRILLATDGSASSELAARSIARRPWPKDTEVRILSAVEFAAPPVLTLIEPPGINFEVNEESRAEGMRHSQNAVETAAGIISATCPTVSQTISVLTDRPSTIILDEADRWDPDLIVVGSHGHGAMDRFLLGSISEKVATYAHCSVEVVRPKVKAAELHE